MAEKAGANYHEGIPGWCAFEESYKHAIARVDPSSPGQMIFVEVGSWLGRSAAVMAELIRKNGLEKKIEFVCVDPWIDGGPDLRDTVYFKELKGASVYETFLKNVKPWADIVIPLRQFSVEASAAFADQSIDYIMLDGDHNYEGIHADIEAWLPKMKPGSIMAGDDYWWPGVTRAVDEFFSASHRVEVRGKAHANYKSSAAYWWVQL